MILPTSEGDEKWPEMVTINAFMPGEDEVMKYFNLNKLQKK